jgi:hypothetical protein
VSQFWSFDLSHYILQSNFNALVEKVGASAYNWKGEEGERERERERERESHISPVQQSGACRHLHDVLN